MQDYLNGYMAKRADLYSNLGEFVASRAAKAIRNLSDKLGPWRDPRSKIEGDVRTTMQNLKPDIDKQVADASDIAAKNIQQGIQQGVEASDIEGQVMRGVQEGAVGAGEQTWKSVKPFVLGAGGLAIGLPLLMLGLSAADRVMLHRRLKELGVLQRRETELEEEQTALAREGRG